MSCTRAAHPCSCPTRRWLEAVKGQLEEQLGWDQRHGKRDQKAAGSPSARFGPADPPLIRAPGVFIRPAPSLLPWLITVHDWGGDAGAAGIVIRREGEEKVLVGMRGRDGVGSTRES